MKGAEKIAQFTTKLLLWLFVLNLGIAFGAGLSDRRLEGARYSAFLVADRRPVGFGR